MRKTIFATATAVALAAAPATWATDLGQMGDINDLAQDFGWNDEYALSDDFFERNGWDGFGDFGNLDDAERKFDYSFRIEELEEEYEGADYKFKDDSTYVVVYKSRGYDPPYTMTHVYLKETSALNLKPDGKGLVVNDLNGKQVYSLDVALADGIMKSAGRTTGMEVALRSDRQMYTPEKGMSMKELEDKGVIAVFKSYLPFFWTDLRELDALKPIGYGNDEETESETEKKKETEDDGIEIGEATDEDEVDHEKVVRAAIGSVGAGEYYVFQCSAGMSFDDVGTIMASNGCTYAAPIESSAAYLEGKQVFGGKVKDGYGETEDVEIETE